MVLGEGVSKGRSCEEEGCGRKVVLGEGVWKGRGYGWN